MRPEQETVAVIDPTRTKAWTNVSSDSLVSDRCTVDEWILSVIKAMNEDSSTKVRMNGRESRAFNVGVHQGSVLSPLLFVLEALSKEFREGLPMEMLYADDLVLNVDTNELLLEVRKWKEGMEKKGLRVNPGKTNVMWCRLSMGQAEDSGEHPCGVCRNGVGDNSILYVECLKWVHKRRSGISGKLESNVDWRMRMASFSQFC